jgi:[ribosomal protein S5]-alanine N-acetyltransferase
MRAIETDALTLEPQTAAHAEEMFEVLSDPAIYEYENEPPPSLEWLRDRFARLETRLSPDGEEHWLNWVIRLPTGELAGYVQATVRRGGRAEIAYELSSRYWGRGLARRAVEAMISELAESYRVRHLSAVLKRENMRSLRLLERLGFTPAADAEQKVEPDELLMLR